MKVKAAIAFAAGKPLEIELVDLEGPKAGEVLVELKATGVCHTDEFTRSGADPEGIFPSILGHEGAGVVVEVGPGPKAVKDDLVAHLVELTGGGADYSFECVGNVDLMRQALECCHRGWGVSIVIGVAGAGRGDRGPGRSSS